MRIKKDLEITTSEFWYDLTAGGYLKPEEICEGEEDAKSVSEAIKIIQDFEESCEEQIEGFLCTGLWYT